MMTLFAATSTHTHLCKCIPLKDRRTWSRRSVLGAACLRGRCAKILKFFYSVKMAERICGELGETSFFWNIPASRENSNNLRISFQTSSVDGTVEIGSQTLCSKLMTILSTLTALPNKPMIQGENHRRTIPHPIASLVASVLICHAP